MIYRYVFFFFNETGTPEIYPDCTTLSLHDARPICEASDGLALAGGGGAARLGRYGVLSAAGALSETRAVRGRQLSLGHSWSNGRIRSEEHTSELQSLMRISYAVFCLKNKQIN